MDGIQQGRGVQSTPTTAPVPQDRRGELPHAESRHTEATVLTLTSATAGKTMPSAPGLAALYALLQGMQSAELHALPPRTTQLLAELGRHLLPVSDLGSTRLRNAFLSSGLFLDADLAQENDLAADAASPRMPMDLKSLLGQLLALMQPGRQLTMRNGTTQFISLNPGTAQCLQAYAEEQKHGPRQNKIQARLLANVETAYLGIVRNQMQSLTQSSATKTRWIMDLLIKHEGGPVTVPVTLSHQAQAVPEVWEAEFELELRHCGHLHVVLGVKNSTVSVYLAAGRPETLDFFRSRKLPLAQILSRKGLTLGSYVCQRGQHERLAG